MRCSIRVVLPGSLQNTAPQRLKSPNYVQFSPTFGDLIQPLL